MQPPNKAYTKADKTAWTLECLGSSHQGHQVSQHKSGNNNWHYFTTLKHINDLTSCFVDFYRHFTKSWWINFLEESCHVIKFSHFSIKIGNNMTHIDFNLTVILIYILLVNHRHTSLTLNMRGYAVILILFLRFGRQKFTSAIFWQGLPAMCQCLLPSMKMTAVHTQN